MTIGVEGMEMRSTVSLRCATVSSCSGMCPIDACPSLLVLIRRQIFLTRGLPLPVL